MERPKGTERLDTLKERLYERGAKQETRGRTPLEDVKHEVRRSWDSIRSGKKVEKEIPKPPPQQIQTEPPQSQTSQEVHTHMNAMPRSTKKRSYRLKILLAGTVFFVVALALSSGFLFLGNNTISGENITIDVSGPFAVGGGEELPLQIAISNQNSVPIESATLIIEYPIGTQSATETGRELFSERQQLNVIGSGEVVNVPVRAIAFGEENEEKVVNVAVEYRVRGSNATFFKEAEPLRFKISSSPVVLSVDSIERISSGQEAEITLTVGSNSPTPLSDILIKAIYPFGFDFTESDPETVSGQDTWKISTLEPEEQSTITISGIVVGKQDEDRLFEFSAGVPNERDPFTLASTFTSIEREISIEQPFLGVGVNINGSDSNTVPVQKGNDVRTNITLRNSLDDTLYDGRVEVVLSGNALNEFDIDVANGFYDSTTNTITWDSTDVSSLSEIAPGRSGNVTFTLKPQGDTIRTPEIALDITVSGQRVFEDRVPQQLTGTAERTIRVESVTTLSSNALYEAGPFINTGPIPPVVEKLTQYTLSFSLQNGSNDITDGSMTAVLPQYITWLDLVTSGDDVSYSPTTRTVTWDIGDLNANERSDMSFQVSFVPSTSQVGAIPTIIETQRFRATDRFTGTVVRTDASALTTSLFNDPDAPEDSGRVLADEEDEG